jgi:osmotically-inducible protein OsmY
MQKTQKLRRAVLVVSVSSALALPALGYGHSGTDELPSDKSVHSSSNAGPESSAHKREAVGGKSASRTRNNLAPSEFFTQADRDLVRRVREDLRADPSLVASAQKLDITARQGDVLLRGTVKDEQEKIAMTTKAQQIMGVERVESQLQVSGGLSRRESSGSLGADSAHRFDRGDVESSRNTVHR